MTIRLREVVRSTSEVEGGLTGPANPIPSQSIDCGCGQMQCPKLARFATRGLYVGLICWIGMVQAAIHAYFYVTGSTIARRFQLDPYLMNWILVVGELTPILFGVLIAYWGDRIHRVSWIGALTLLQSVSYFILIIPHLTHGVRVIEKTGNGTHMSLYADDSPILCNVGISKIITEEDVPCYFTMSVLIVVLIITGIANITYYALGISYLDDNTKGRHVSSFIGIIIAVKIIGLLFGYLLVWECLRIDADNLNVIESYQDEIGAWWLGFPILAALLVIPGLFLSWFPRRLPSEVVEQAAASILDRASIYTRASNRTINTKVGSPDFCPSFYRLINNKILICNILATVFLATALINFIMYENVFLESRFHMPRPTGMFLGFNDPLSSRVVMTIVKPILIGLIIIISGLILAKSKPQARTIVAYSFIIVLLIIAIIILLIFVTCERPPIVNMTDGSKTLLKYCNKDCRCSKDTSFQPICDTSGMYTFYSPCHAGCTSTIYVDNARIYSDCECVEDMTGWGNDQGKDGPCDSLKCQSAWMLFEFSTLIAYGLAASTIVGDILINIRSVYRQDKAIAIGFWMTWIAIFVYVPGKILYEVVSHQACQYWGNQKITCHLHDEETLGNYLCYLTILFLSLCLIFKIIVWFFCKKLQLYEEAESKSVDDVRIPEMTEYQPATYQPRETIINNDNPEGHAEQTTEVESHVISETAKSPEENPSREEENRQTNAPLKYGPLGPGDRRTTVNLSTTPNSRSTIGNLDSEDELDSSSDESKKQSVAYRELEIDSDVESDLSSTGPRSRKRISGNKEYYQIYYKDDDNPPSSPPPPTEESSVKRSFPNPDHYQDPQVAKNIGSSITYLDGSSKTGSFEFAKRRQQGDFNEIGIPIVNPLPHERDNPNTMELKDVKSLIDRYEQNASQESLDDDRSSVKSTEHNKTRLESRIVSGIPLVAMVPGRSSSRERSSPRSGSLSDVQGKSSDSHLERREITSSKDSVKTGKPAFRTDL